MFEGENVLVAGGTGFVGVNLINRLLSLGANVRATIHRKDPVIMDERIEYVKCDLTRMEDCKKVVSDMDYVYLCAASTSGAAVIQSTPLVHVTPNIVMNSQMLEAAYFAKVKKFVWLSSNAAYPPSGDRPVKEEELFDGDPYETYFGVAWMKRYTEILCRMYSEKLKNPMTTVVLRPSNIYGPYDDFDFATSHVMAAQIRKVIERHDPIEVWGTGNDVRDLIYIDDFIDAMILATEKIESYNPINIASGKGYSVKEILQIILEVDGYTDARIEFDTAKPSMIPIRLIDTTKAESILGFKPKTGLREGIKKIIDWYRGSKLKGQRGDTFTFRSRMKQYFKKPIHYTLAQAKELLILSNQKHLASNLMRIIRFRDPVFRILNKESTFTERTLAKIQSLHQEKQQLAILEKDILADGLNTAEEFFKPLNKFGIALSGKIGMDVGCGRGAACIYAIKAGMCEVTGIDPYKANFLNFPNKNTISENVLKRVNLLEMDIVNSDFGRFEKSFDIIWSKNCFEHIPNPKKALSNIVFMLKPGGHFFASFAPLFNSVGGSHQDDVIGIPYHQHIFDDKTIYDYLENSGKLKDVHTIIFTNNRDPYPDVNRLPFSYYKKLFIEECPEFNLLRFPSYTTSLKHIHMYRFFNKDASKLSLRELATCGILVLMQKI